MIEWFLALDKTIQSAIICGVATIFAAIIAGFFSIWPNWRKHKDIASSDNSTITITQSSSGHHNTFIGIQNNGKDEGK